MSSRRGGMGAARTGIQAGRAEVAVVPAPTVNPFDTNVPESIERPQPLTPDTIPDPPEVPRDEADTSALTADEEAEYAACEKALAHYRQATWMYGKALQVIRDARYYRQEFPTWVDFLRYRCGISESQAHRVIEEWPLAAALTRLIGSAPVQSHVRGLMPVHKTYGGEASARLYGLLLSRAEAAGSRLTAEDVQGATKAVLARVGRHAELEQVQDATRAVLEGTPALETTGETPSRPEPEERSAEQVSVRELRAALKSVRAAHETLTRATVTEALTAAPEDAAHLLQELEAMAGKVAKRARYRPKS